MVKAAAYHSVGLFVFKPQFMHVVLQRHVRILSPVQLMLQRLYGSLKVFVDLIYLFLKFAFQELFALLSFVFLLHELHLQLSYFFFKFKFDVQQRVCVLFLIPPDTLH